MEEWAAGGAIAILPLASEHLVVQRMEHRFEIILAVLAFISAMSLAVLKVVGLVDKLLSNLPGDHQPPTIPFMMIERALILKVLILVVSGNLSRLLGAIGVRAWQDLVEHDLSKVQDLVLRDRGDKSLTSHGRGLLLVLLGGFAGKIGLVEHLLAGLALGAEGKEELFDVGLL
jgi:hypothetical protein